jgi:peptidoglycan/LPS O-acetylase OafA/YrhL
MTRLRRAVLAVAGCVVLALLILAVFSDPDFVIIAIYLSVAFILGGLLGQTIQEWVYAEEIEDATSRKLRFVDRASMFAWISLLLLVEIGLIIIIAQYSTGFQLFFHILLAAGCMLLTYYPYHLELRDAYRNRGDDADHSP